VRVVVVVVVVFGLCCVADEGLFGFVGGFPAARF